METFIHYLLQSSLSVAVLYIAFRLFFAQQGYFRINRLILWIILAFGFFGTLASALVFSGFSNYGLLPAAEQITGQTFEFSLTELTVSTSGFSPSLNYFSWVIWIYLSVAGLMALKLSWNTIRLMLLVVRSKKFRKDRFVFVELPEGSPAFSFLRLLFIPEDLLDQENDPIILHEKVHARQWHTLDLVFVELLLIMQWFNPFVYALRKSVIANNEFLADRQSISATTNLSDYKILMLQSVLASKKYYLTYHFSYSLIKKRIKMMEKKKSQIQLIISALAFLMVFAVVGISCSNQNSSDQLEETIVIPVEKEVQEPGEGDPPPPPKEGEEKVGEDVFTVVDTPPQYPGGMESLYKFIGDNIKYPEQAKKDKVTGKVFVNFIVEKDGSVTNVKVIRGIGGGCDEEAVRVVSMMPDWTPGTQRDKPVRVSFNLPINFVLD